MVLCSLECPKDNLKDNNAYSEGMLFKHAGNLQEDVVMFSIESLKEINANIPSFDKLLIQF